MPQYAVNNPWADNMRGVSALAQALGGMINPDNSRVLQAQLVGAQRDSAYADADLTNQKTYDLRRIAGGQERFAAKLPALARIMVEGQTPPVSPIQVQGGALPVQMGDGLTVSQGGPDMGGLAGLLGGPGATGAGQLEVAPAAPQPPPQIPQTLLAELMADLFIGANGDTRFLQNAPGVLMTAGGPQVLGGDADLSRILTGFGTPFQNTPEAFTRSEARLDTDSIRDNETQRYGYKTQAESSRYGADRQYASSVYNTDSTARTQMRGQDIDSADTRRGQDIESTDRRYTVDNKPQAAGGGKPLTNPQELKRDADIEAGLRRKVGGTSVSGLVMNDARERFRAKFAETGDLGEATRFAIDDTPVSLGAKDKNGGRVVTFWNGKGKPNGGAPLSGRGSAKDGQAINMPPLPPGTRPY
jgi:hypothetical protein